MREDSVLNILLNNKFVAAIPCKDSKGGIYRNYKLELMMSSMSPGYNKLVIAPRLVPLITDQCSLIQTGNLRVTVFEDSTLTIPAVDQWIEMPHLGAFMADAFPFGRFPDMGESIIFIPDARKSSFISALNLVSIGAQKIGFPPLGLEWKLSFAEETAGSKEDGAQDKGFKAGPKEDGAQDQGFNTDKDIIIVSQAHALPRIFKDAAPFYPASPGSVPYPHLTRPKGYEASREKGCYQN